jgi:hypothetical protein
VLGDTKQGNWFFVISSIHKILSMASVSMAKVLTATFAAAAKFCALSNCRKQWHLEDNQTSELE